MFFLKISWLLIRWRNILDLFQHINHFCFGVCACGLYLRICSFQQIIFSSINHLFKRHIEMQWFLYRYFIVLKLAEVLHGQRCFFPDALKFLYTYLCLLWRRLILLPFFQTAGLVLFQKHYIDQKKPDIIEYRLHNFLYQVHEKICITKL